MPGIQDLLALVGGGGGGAPAPGGGAPAPQAGPTGGQLAQVIGQLMQSPAAQKGMQNFLAGQPPTAGMPGLTPDGRAVIHPGTDPRAGMAAAGVPQSRMAPTTGAPGALVGRGAVGPATDSDLAETAEANQGVRGNLRPMPDTGGYTGYGQEYDPQEDPRQTPKGEPDADDAEKMASDQIDKAGQTFDGVDAPTQGDIDRLLEAPTDSMVEAFDAQFGDGMAARYIDPSGDQEDAAPTPQNGPPDEGE